MSDERCAIPSTHVDFVLVFYLENLVHYTIGVLARS